ncbi:MAG: creatininase family protein [Mariniphaga sp.]|nr:creatininase family protein [Mariniphaga sp.]
MRPYILEETNWKQITSQKYDVAILPWGATEPHNYHLPYGTDSLETARIAAEAAEKAWVREAKVMVLPTIPLGVQNPGQINLPFCLHTPPSTQLIILENIVRALYHQDIRKLIVMNGHGGNDFKPLIREILPKFPGMFIALNEWFKLVSNSEFFEEDGDHANEMETSIIMHYFPQLVLPLDQAGEGKAKKPNLLGLNNKTAWTPRQWDKVTDDTGVGNPKKATAEKGGKFLEKITSQIAEFIVELAKININDIYT